MVNGAQTKQKSPESSTVTGERDELRGDERHSNEGEKDGRVGGVCDSSPENDAHSRGSEHRNVSQNRSRNSGTG